MAVEMVLWRCKEHFRTPYALESDYDNRMIDVVTHKDELTLFRVVHPG